MDTSSFPPQLLARPWPERLAYFHSYTVAHPTLVEAKEKLLCAIQDSAPNTLILVLGPAGVGKTTLRHKIEQVLTRDLAPDLAADPTRLPVVSIEAMAYDARTFNWGDHFHRLLLEMEEPLVAYKIAPPPGAPPESSRGFRLGRRPTAAAYQHAAEQALTFRRPKAVLIDEAQHLAKIPSGRKLADQLDVIKSIASRTRTVHVLFGTYDLLAFRNLSGQLSRRSIDIHFRRYQLDDPSQKNTFRGVLRSFEQHLPLAEPPDLLQQWDYLYERSIGCVGVLKQWLNRALAIAARQNATTFSRQILEASRLSVAQCEKMLAEALEGEHQLIEREEDVRSLRLRLGLKDDASEKNRISPTTDVVKQSDPRRRRRPGERRPFRDKVGVGGPVYAESAGI
jgi:energy-coupling factor transporter ATP-binding protein EcfA2